MPKAITEQERRQAAFDEKVTHALGLVVALLEHLDLSTDEGCTVLAGLLMDCMVSEIDAGNPKVAKEMKRMADRLNVLADCAPGTCVQTAIMLADSTPKN